jgi:hypothetical protein
MPRNFIQFSIPLTLCCGRTVRTIECKLTPEALEGYTTDPLTNGDEILLDFEISSGSQPSQKTCTVYQVTHAHPEVLHGDAAHWFMAIPNRRR